MADQKLLDYINQNIGNLGETGVRQRLAENGWEESQISEAIAQYRKGQAAPKAAGGGLSMNMILIIVAVIAVAAIAVIAMVLLPGIMAPAATECGDGTCDSGETYSNCPADCEAPGPTSYCGDGTCDSGETSSTCPADCVYNPCGNGQCEASETYSSCPADCPPPGPGPSPAPPIGVSVSPATQTVSSGSTVTVDIMAGGAEDLFGFQFDLAFNPSVLRYEGVQEGDFLSKSGADSTFNGGPDTSVSGMLNDYYVSRLGSGGVATAVSGDGKLATVTFTAISSGTSQLALSDVKFADPQANSIQPVTTDGQVTVS